MDKIRRNAKADYNIQHENEINTHHNTFVQNIKTAREQLGLSQKDIANKLKISLPTYIKYEQGGNRRDTPFYMYSLAEALNVSADYLIGKSLTPHPEYDKIIATTGLNEKSIQQLQKLNTLDGNAVKQGYMNFINCFLGNEICTDLFFEALLPLLRDLNESIEYNSNKTMSIRESELSCLINDYIIKVVLPTYIQLYSTGSYTTPKATEYLNKTSDDAQKKG